MRHIAALGPDKVARDDEFKFRDRAQALVNKWHNTVNSAAPAADGTMKAAMNGAVMNGAPVPDSATSEGVLATGGMDGLAVAAGDMTMDTTLGDMTMMTDVAV